MVDRCQVLGTLRVLELGDATTAPIGRLLADLGADVLTLDTPGRVPQRSVQPTVAGVDLAALIDDANKRSATLDPADAADRTRFLELVADADILIDGGQPAGTSAFGTSGAELAMEFGHLVVLAASDFGSTGPKARWRATDAQLYAMSTALSRSGPTTGRPVLPPEGIASNTAAVQAAWVVLAAYYRRLRCGVGDYIDFSRYEAVVQALDPPFGSEGQAAVGLKSADQLWRGRPRNQQIYPTLPCRDGFVRVCLLSARQWRGMWSWLGEPQEFADPKFETIAARYVASAQLNAAMAALFAPQSMEALVAEGQRRGIPVAAVLTPSEALDSEHLQAVGALTEVQFGSNVRLPVPSGPFVLDGRRAGLAAQPVGAVEGRPEWRASVARDATPGAEAVARPFDGLRILDLGVIVAGGELGRLFADLGADVIKVESAAYPDGLRQTPPGQSMSRSWALTHRNERSLGLDLRHPEGAEVFRRLVAGADAVFANFKPGTLDSLGFSDAELRRINPGLVLAESSAFGATGPWSGRMGYGPLVRATTGVSRLWRSADPSDEGFYDATTVYPDHAAARITAVGALAALINKMGSGAGSHVHVSQAEVAINQLAVAYVADAARSRGLDVADGANGARHGVYPCAGDDEWCVISVRSPEERAALDSVVDAELPTARAEFDAVLAGWTSTRDGVAVSEALQRVGVPAAPMYRAVDVLADSQLSHRDVFADMVHPLFEVPMPTERRAAPMRNVPDADLRPAPMPGEHTREICAEYLGMTDADLERLHAAGVLFTWSETLQESRSAR